PPTSPLKRTSLPARRAATSTSSTCSRRSRPTRTQVRAPAPHANVTSKRARCRPRGRGHVGGHGRSPVGLADRPATRTRATTPPLPTRIERAPGQDAARTRPRSNQPLHAAGRAGARPDVRHRHHPGRGRPPRPASNRPRTRAALGTARRRQHPPRRSTRRKRECDRATRRRAPARPQLAPPVPRPLHADPHLAAIRPLDTRPCAQARRPSREAQRPLLQQPGQPRPPAHTQRTAHATARVRHRARRDPHRLRTHARARTRAARAHRAPLPRARCARRSARPADPPRRTKRSHVLLARGRAPLRPPRQRARAAGELLPALPPARRNDRTHAPDRPRRRARLPTQQAAEDERVSGQLTIACTLQVPEELVRALAEQVAAHLAATMPSPRPVSPWLDLEGACEYLCFTRDQLYKLTAAKAIPFRKKRGGQGLLFHRDELDRWLQAAYEPTGCADEVELWSSTEQK